MKKDVTIVIIIIAIIVAFGIYSQVKLNQPIEQEQGYTDITSVEAKALIDSNPEIIIIDVSGFYEQGHIPGAINYKVVDGTLRKNLHKLDKDATYLVYCRVATNSLDAIQEMVNAGFKNLYRLSDHYSGWEAAGYPIEQ